MNVRKLKTDLWGYLDSACVDKDKDEYLKGEQAEKKDFGFEGASSDPSTAAMEAHETVSFQDCIHSIASSQKQKEVTLPFYFICLLHLANEKTLKIEGKDDLSDLIISKN